jgi:hypothetical protein
VHTQLPSFAIISTNLSSDAHSTGKALYALREAGFITAADPAHRRGVQYLLRTQYSDGSWYVRSRAVGFQPYFQSGFPFEHDQWISAAGTAWAAEAIARGIQFSMVASAAYQWSVALGYQPFPLMPIRTAR